MKCRCRCRPRVVAVVGSVAPPAAAAEPELLPLPVRLVDLPRREFPVG